jgi:hypothetical protein
LVALSQTRRGQVFEAGQAVGVSSIRTMSNASVFVDTWGNPLWFKRDVSLLQYDQNGNPLPQTITPEIVSAGRDKQFSTNDDISSVDLRQTAVGGQ